MIRPATTDDLTAVAAIYDHQVAHGYATFDTEPRPPASWAAKLDSAHPGDRFLVAEEGGDVLGFAYSSAYRERGAYHHTRETTVYVEVPATGRRIGRMLYDELLRELTAAGMHTTLACIALPNDASEALHRACGFQRIGVMREVGRKLDRWIDVAWFQKML